MKVGTLANRLDLQYDYILFCLKIIKGTVRSFIKNANNFSTIKNREELKIQDIICLFSAYRENQELNKVPETLTKSLRKLLRTGFKIPQNYEEIKKELKLLLDLETLVNEEVKFKQLKIEMCIFALLSCPRKTEMLDSKTLNKLDDRILFPLLIKKYTQENRVSQKDLEEAAHEHKQWISKK